MSTTLHLFTHWLWTKTLLMKKQGDPFPQLIRSTCSMVRISSSFLQGNDFLNILSLSISLASQLLFHFPLITISSVFCFYFIYHAIPTWSSTSSFSARIKLRSIIATFTIPWSEVWHTTTALKIKLQACSEHWNDYHRDWDVLDYIQ